MLDLKRKKELEDLTNDSLDIAEQIWKRVGHELSFKSARQTMIKMTESVDSQIPGYPLVDIDKPMVDEFIALVADMRGSTDHLMCRISPQISEVTELERLFYETSALLPVLAKSIGYYNGNVTEYLGDGVLALFRCKEAGREQVVRNSKHAADICLEACKEIINPILSGRYSLPELKIGVGLAYSKAIVTLVGLPAYMQPKVYGKCIYRATKLSGGANEIRVDEPLRYIWPTSRGGKLRFTAIKVKKVKGFIVSS